MKRGFEGSDLSENIIEARPGEFFCACCKNGGAECTAEDPEKVDALLKRIKEDQNVHVVFKTAFDDAGARTELYEKTTVAQRKRDLDILRDMGTIPESVRTAKIWAQLMEEYIPSCSKICAPFKEEHPGYKNCSNADKDFYAKGLKSLCPERDKCEKACVKESSCKALAEAKAFSIRAHHLMCIICHRGGSAPDSPLIEDNLYEAWLKIVENHDIPITVIEGPGNCVICPPCYAFNKNTGLCFVSCSLRDRKRDTDVFSILGIQPGDTLPAREIYRRICKHIKNVKGICHFEERRGFEWKNCGQITDTRYMIGREDVMREFGFKEEEL